MKVSNVFFWRYAAILSLVLLTVGAGVGALLPQTAPPGNGVDLVLHLLFYGAFTVVASQVSGRLWLVGPLVLSYSAVLEGLQNLVPARNGSVEDLAANALGVVGGLLVVAIQTKTNRSGMEGAHDC